MPRDWCPFCPGSGKVPDSYSVFLYPNDFAAFSLAEDAFSDSRGLYAATGARGVCDVVLYSPDHHRTPAQLSVSQWREVIGLWTSRSEELYAMPGIAYVAVFENQGEAIGVTMPHPHGQIYALPMVPPLVAAEVEGAKLHHDCYGECLHCRVLAEELEADVRIVARNRHFVAFVPHYCRFPSEVHLYALRHAGRLGELDPGAETQALAEILSEIRRRYDGLYGFPLPLMMAVRQRSNGDEAERKYAHLHIQFTPLQRSATKLKFLAAAETAHGLYLNDTKAEDQAEALRQVPLSSL